MNILKRWFLSPSQYYVKLKPRGHWGVWHVNGNEILSSSSREDTHDTARNYAKAMGMEIREA